MDQYDPNPRRVHHDPALEFDLRRPSYDYDSKAYRYDPIPDYDLKAYRYDYGSRAYQHDSTYDYVNQTKRATRNIRLVAPTFSGYLDLKDYLDWEESMKIYFEEDDMTEERKYKIFKLRLNHQARIN